MTPHERLDPLTSHMVQAVALYFRAEGKAVITDVVVSSMPEVIRRAMLPPYLGRRELSELTGWTLSKIDHMRRQGRLPYIKRGRSVLFKTADVERHLDAGRVPARRPT